MRITAVKAFGLSYRYDVLPRPLATGQSFKRDAVIVRVETEDGIVGYGEAYHGKAPTAIVELIDTTLANLVVGEDSDNTEGIWNKVFHRHVRGAGLGAAVMAGLGGIDMALWDAKGKRYGQPVYRLLGGERRRFRAYAGGIRLGFQPPEELVEEVARLRARGFTAAKLRIGDSFERDIARVSAVRDSVDDDFLILVDANLGFTSYDIPRMLPRLRDLGVGWLEEPFGRTDIASFASIRARGDVPIATGEHLYGVREFLPLLEAGGADIVQPDPSSAGGISELKKIGDLAGAFNVGFAPHITNTRINQSAVLHVLSAVPAGYLYEADATDNLYAQRVAKAPIDIDPDGCVGPPEAPGLGVVVDEEAFADFPVIAGSPHVQDRPRGA